MKKPVLFAVALGIALSGSSMFSPSRAVAGVGTRNNSTANETYLVVQIGDEYKVVPKSRLKDEQKRIEEDYKKAFKEWQDLRKIEPDAKRPVKYIIKRIGTPFQTEKIAQEEVQRLKDEAANKDKAALK
jgi:hypothetical protein